LTRPKPDSNPSQPMMGSSKRANPSAVIFDNVGLRYGRGPEILSDVNLDLSHGSFSFLTGPSGAGKSSLLKLCYLALTQSRGRITLFGQDTSRLANEQSQALRRRIGVVLQDFTLIDHLSVFENVALPLRVATLSGGEKQRAAIARAVIAKPNFLIADEPTGNVDPEIARRLLRLFAEMNRVGTTVLIATHDTHLIQEIDARVIRIENGRVFKGAPTQAMQNDDASQKQEDE